MDDLLRALFHVVQREVPSVTEEKFQAEFHRWETEDRRLREIVLSSESVRDERRPVRINARGLRDS
jgi:hypothetical protein